MNLQILNEAEEELNEAVAYYEGIEPDLGTRLKEEVRAALQWIGVNPDVPRMRPKGYRRLNLKVFPYYIAYFAWADVIWILAIAHACRRPEYWLSRKRKAV